MISSGRKVLRVRGDFRRRRGGANCLRGLILGGNWAADLVGLGVAVARAGSDGRCFFCERFVFWQASERREVVMRAWMTFDAVACRSEEGIC
jgi:hypothetical protein